jgi:hypothetical protein
MDPSACESSAWAARRMPWTDGYHNLLVQASVCPGTAMARGVDLNSQPYAHFNDMPQLEISVRGLGEALTVLMCVVQLHATNSFRL